MLLAALGSARLARLAVAAGAHPHHDRSGGPRRPALLRLAAGLGRSRPAREPLRSSRTCSPPTPSSRRRTTSPTPTWCSATLPLAWVTPAGQSGALAQLNLALLIATAMAAFGGYVLARVLGARIPGALVAAVGFAFAPWRDTQVIHINVVSTGGIALSAALILYGHAWSLRAGWRPERVRGREHWVLAGWLVACWQLTIGFATGIWFGYFLALIMLCLVTGWLLVVRRHAGQHGRRPGAGHAVPTAGAGRPGGRRGVPGHDGSAGAAPPAGARTGAGGAAGAGDARPVLAALVRPAHGGPLEPGLGGAPGRLAGADLHALAARDVHVARRPADRAGRGRAVHLVLAAASPPGARRGHGGPRRPGSRHPWTGRRSVHLPAAVGARARLGASAHSRPTDDLGEHGAVPARRRSRQPGLRRTGR